MGSPGGQRSADGFSGDEDQPGAGDGVSDEVTYAVQLRSSLLQQAHALESQRAAILQFVSALEQRYGLNPKGDRNA